MVSRCVNAGARSRNSRCHPFAPTQSHYRYLLSLSTGSTLVHKNLEGEPLDVLANDTLIARGEVIVENEKYGIRITEVVSSKERIESLRRDPLKTTGD